MNEIWMTKQEGLGVVPKFGYKKGKLEISNRNCSTCKHSLLHKQSMKVCNRYCRTADGLQGYEEVGK